MVAVIEGNEHARFRAGIEQAFALGIFADHASDARGRETVIDFLPRLAVITGAIEMRMQLLEAVDSSVGRCGIERRGINNA